MLSSGNKKGCLSTTLVLGICSATVTGHLFLSKKMSQGTQIHMPFGNTYF